MAQAPKRPHYSAVVFDEAGKDFGPINLSDAKDDDEAGALAMERGSKLIAASGLDRATIHIVKDGKTFRSIPVESHK